MEDESIEEQNIANSPSSAEKEHKRISSTYEGAEALLQRVLNDEAIQTQLSLEDTSLDQPNSGDDAKESTAAEEEINPSTSESPLPEYQPPARRTSHIMMSFLTEEHPREEAVSELLSSPTPS